jgi:hypothetical protein
VLATFYGHFNPPLHNKEIHTIQILGVEVLKVPHDYRWRLRLYEDSIDYNESGEENINVRSEYGNTYVGGGMVVGSTKNVIWVNESDTALYNKGAIEDKYVQTILYSNSADNNFNPFNDKKTKES